MRNKKLVSIGGLEFATKADLTAHFSGILNKALGRDLSAAEFDQVLALFRGHPEFRQKTSDKRVTRIWVDYVPKKHDDGHFSVKVFKFSTGSGHADDFSMSKCINELWKSAKLGESA